MYSSLASLQASTGRSTLISTLPRKPPADANKDEPRTGLVPVYAMKEKKICYLLDSPGRDPYIVARHWLQTAQASFTRHHSRLQSMS